MFYGLMGRVGNTHNGKCVDLPSCIDYSQNVIMTVFLRRLPAAMRFLGQHNLVTWQRWGGILPQLPAGRLLNRLSFVCFHAYVYNESIFALCLLDCFVWGGVMHMFISVLQVNLGFIPRLRNDMLQMHYSLKLQHLFTSMSSFMHIHS